MKKSELPIVMIGATGVVGGETLKSLVQNKKDAKITIQGAMPIEGTKQSNVFQRTIGRGLEYLKWNDFQTLSSGKI